ncbi:MAG: LD-carboxypeptidase [Chlorobi bacterium]|nr:LD-carboxypeptidase [Chlorobiota bacterium]
MITRKNFIKTTTLLTAASILPVMPSFSQNIREDIKEKPAKIKPERLKKGDTIGLVTPAGVITEKQLNETIHKLESLGLKSYYMPSVLSQYGYFAGTDRERADELVHMFTNKDVDGILCVRGGYGAIRMFDLINYEKIRENPKVFIGYSDITALLNVIFNKTGLITFHGPVGVSTFNDFSVQSLDKVIFNPEKKYKYPYQREENTEENPEFDVYTINKGKAEGELVGGNLSVLASMTGSNYEIDYKDKIVFIEEIDEKVYAVDRWLTILLNGTNLKEAAGIALGVFSNCSKNDEPGFTLKEVLVNILEPLKIPVSYGMPFGHIATKITLPIGVNVKFNTRKNTLQLLENAVV